MSNQPITGNLLRLPPWKLDAASSNVDNRMPLVSHSWEGKPIQASDIFAIPVACTPALMGGLFQEGAEDYLIPISTPKNRAGAGHPFAPPPRVVLLVSFSVIAGWDYDALIAALAANVQSDLEDADVWCIDLGDFTWPAQDVVIVSQDYANTFTDERTSTTFDSTRRYDYADYTIYPERWLGREVLVVLLTGIAAIRLSIDLIDVINPSIAIASPFVLADYDKIETETSPGDWDITGVEHYEERFEAAIAAAKTLLANVVSIFERAAVKQIIVKDYTADYADTWAADAITAIFALAASAAEEVVDSVGGTSTTITLDSSRTGLAGEASTIEGWIRDFYSL